MGGRGTRQEMECHVISMSDDVISPAPPLSVSGPVVSMFAAWRDNLISWAAANAKSHLSEGERGKKEGSRLAATFSHQGSSPLSNRKDLDGTKSPRWCVCTTGGKVLKSSIYPTSSCCDTAKNQEIKSGGL